MTELSKQYENKMKQLAGIVEQLEQGEMSLEENLKNFEKGMELYSELKKILEEKEGKVQRIIQESGEIADFEI